MSASLSEQYRRWFVYEQDAIARVIACFESVPSQNRAGADYRQALAVLAHLVAARQVWLGRLGVIPMEAATMFPDHSGADLTRVAADWKQVSAHWTEYLEGLDDAQVQQVLEYQSLDAGRFRNRIEEILAQLFGHSWYHRGQIATLIRAAGGQPAATDLIYWCRQPVESPAPGTTSSG